MADQVPGLRTAFFERQAEFRWHPGMMIEGTMLQVPFLADLVSLVDPTSRWSFLSYLRASDRLFPFYFAERFHLHRAEYEAYCRWVSRNLPQCLFGRKVESVTWDDDRQAFAVGYTCPDRPGRATTSRCFARNIVLGIGTEPQVPKALAGLLADDRVLALHSADYLSYRDQLAARSHLTVIGSGQSG